RKVQQGYPAEEQYYLGQAVTAAAIANERVHLNRKTGVENRDPVASSEAANHSLNLLGQSLALYSQRPELYAGYRFQILNSEEINAISSPGGHVLVTHGFLARCTSEDE